MSKRIVCALLAVIGIVAAAGCGSGRSTDSYEVPDRSQKIAPH